MHKQNQHQGLFLWEKWVMATAFGSVVGFGAIAAFNAITSRVENVNIYIILLVVGIVEGVVLGFSQLLALRRYIHKPIGWVIFTTIAAVLAWLIGLALSYLMAVAFSFLGDGMKFLVLLPAIVLLGGGVGAVLGFAQWLLFQAYVRIYIRQAGWWVGANTLAWSLGLLIAFMDIGFEQSDGLSIHNALNAAVTGAAMGTVVGASTGIFLVWLMNLSRGGIEN
ncbi:hypothetical protein I8748_24070 [Nostoc sp. CENA67]|uniref:Uncharacterized protein n=1 Tax=Amazonocrinis nigriterrae CENA67 TaxID=2794033 RepID=A0A8J7LA77_9NOST|nr:hypothetical protein [Amazonocrinis nigriterrae]MBH8565223.1 hypothetical protein [Amazonocrinis nigriterrae CENA67]